MSLYDTMMQDLRCGKLQGDEMWCCVQKKDRRLMHKGIGDQYTFIALNADAKLVPSYRAGKRDVKIARSFPELLVLVVTHPKE
jgi:hypothetical protein